MDAVDVVYPLAVDSVAVDVALPVATVTADPTLCKRTAPLSYERV